MNGKPPVTSLAFPLQHLLNGSSGSTSCLRQHKGQDRGKASTGILFTRCATVQCVIPPPDTVSVYYQTNTSNAVHMFISLGWSGYFHAVIANVCLSSASFPAWTVSVRCTLTDAVLAARASMFSLLNFKAVFMLTFMRICVTLLQAVMAFHDMQTTTSSTERILENIIFGLALIKIVACYAVRL